jgi:Fe-S cluster biogenesis protein NfuA
VAHDGEFQEKFRQLGQLVARLDQLPDNECRVAARELVQLLMDLHGAGFERMLEIVFESGDAGQRIIDKLGQDQLTSSLLLLYSLHPDDLETRVHTAVERIRPRLRKLSCTIDSVEVHDGAVRISLTASGHGCGSSKTELRSVVEEGIYELAPDLASLELLGLEEPASAGFVSLETLVAHPLATVASSDRALESEAAD